MRSSALAATPKARTVNGQPSTSDANSTLTARNGVRSSWDAEQRPTSLTGTGVTETSSDDADGTQVTRTRGGVMTVDLGGALEQAGGVQTRYYRFNGQVIAQRSLSGTCYLHGDHRGSVSLTTTSSGALLSQQEFAPWGRVRSGGISQTTLNYTGQRLDGTGLLYYHARYYDPGLGRFLSADSVVPGAGPLTAAPHDATAQAAWGQGGGGPANPQDLNRYAYGLNNPVRNTDPTGHCIPYIGDCRPFWEEGVTYTGWEDFKQYSAGVVEGMGSLGAVAASLLIAETYQTAYQGAQNLIADPTGSAAYLREQLVDPVVRGTEFLMNDPAGAAAALNNDPRGVGRVLGTVAGITSLSEGALSGREIKIGSDFRLAPFGNRTGHPTGRFPHYHRRRAGPGGVIQPGQGMKRHRPWDVKSNDTSFWDRF